MDLILFIQVSNILIIQVSNTLKNLQTKTTCPQKISRNQFMFWTVIYLSTNTCCFTDTFFQACKFVFFQACYFFPGLQTLLFSRLANLLELEGSQQFCPSCLMQGVIWNSPTRETSLVYFPPRVFVFVCIWSCPSWPLGHASFLYFVMSVLLYAMDDTTFFVYLQLCCISILYLLVSCILY